MMKTAWNWGNGYCPCNGRVFTRPAARLFILPPCSWRPFRRALRASRKSFWSAPYKDGQLNPLIAAAAEVARVDRIFKIGGAQAIAALAYGTQTIPRVDKIVGPGNAYVAAAKKLVFGQVAIDMIAGPSEVVVIADQTANPAFAAADMLAQAEHDEMAAAVLFTPFPDLADGCGRRSSKADANPAQERDH